MLIIFDCDGVLVDSEIIAAEVFATHLSKLATSVTPQECFERFKGQSMKTCMTQIVEMIGQPIPKTFLKAMQRETFERFQTELKVVEGIVSALDSLEGAGFNTCIASSGSYAKMDVTLGKTNLLERFSGRIYSAVDVKKGKPAPDVFLYAAKQQGFEAGRCVVIEDSKPGVAAGLSAGMRVLHFLAEQPEIKVGAPVEASGATAGFNHMDQLPALMNRLRAKEPLL